MARWAAIAIFSIALLVENTEGKTHRKNLTNSDENKCTNPSIDEFPRLPLPDSPITSTLIVLAAVSYLFVFLIRVCDKHFVSCIKNIGKAANLSSDVAGATLMASAVSCPDLFINLIGTFITRGDIGIGTIVGCGIFNTLAIPALCILMSPNKSIRLKGWSLSRDSLFYGGALIVLAFALSDNRIELYEALTLVSMYVLYILVLAVNSWLRNKTETAINFCILRESNPERTPLLLKTHSVLSYGVDSEDDSLPIDHDAPVAARLWCYLTSPIDCILGLTIPKSTSTVHGVKLYLVTFFICLVWIAIASYVIAWLITIAGFQIGIPDSMIGLTFIAIGMSVPQAASSIIIAKQGDGAMALSNAIGSNVFDNLLCLGLPWLLKCLIYEDSYVEISSKSIAYTFFILFLSLLFMYSTAVLNKFRLNLMVGVSLLGLYILFATLSAMLELNIFFVANLPLCFDMK